MTVRAAQPVRSARGLPRQWRPARLRLSTHTATVGLVLVLLVLTVFSVTASFVNARAAGQAERSAAVASSSERAEQALLQMEDLADELALDAGPESRGEYEQVSAQLRSALVALAEVEDTGHRALLDDWTALHAAYVRAVEEQLEVAATQDRNAIEAFEEDHVDPHYDALDEVVKGEAKTHWAQARREMEVVGRFQRVLLVATPAVFALGLTLVALFASVLARSRRATLEQAEQNRHQALHDALTSLPNRSLLADLCEQALRADARDGTATGLLLIDLDRFQEINDTLGHHFGDELLTLVGPRLSGALRQGDTVARLGGDEFAVLLPGTADVPAAEHVAHKLQAALHRPFTVGEVDVDVEASIGVVLSGAHGTSSVELLQRADVAMYAAKQGGVGVAVYDPDSDRYSPERLTLFGDLRRALLGDELFLHFQPKVNLSTGQVCGAEALVRWQHPERGMVAPDAFIPLAENTGLIGPLTTRVLTLALAQARRWADAGAPLQVAVNLSARNLLDEHLDTQVRDLLAQHGVAPAMLKLEVTESAIMTDPARARLVLERLSDLGIALSLDDFGAGYTSLGQLKHLPITELKVDRSFVGTMHSDSSDGTIVRSVVELGHNLGLIAVAEGVEDIAALEQLSSLGCDVVQGYFVSRPLTADAFDAWRSTWPGLPPLRQAATGEGCPADLETARPTADR